MGSSLCRSSVCSAGLKGPGPVGVLPRLQGGCDCLSPLILDAVVCSSSKEEEGFEQQVRRRSQLPAHPLTCPLTRSGGKAGGHHYRQETGGWGMRETRRRGVGSSPNSISVCSAGLKAQVPSGFSLGSRAAATAFSPLILDVVDCSSSKEEEGFGQQVRRRTHLPAHPLTCPLTRSGGKAGGHHFRQETGGWEMRKDEEEGVWLLTV